MDIHLRVTVAMLAATFAGQITTYLCLLVFPSLWDKFDSKPPENVCDANSIIIMRVGNQSGQTSGGDGGCGPADEGGGGNGGGRCAAQGNDAATVPARRASVCTCFGLVNCAEEEAKAGRCPKCNRERRPPNKRRGPQPTTTRPAQSVPASLARGTQVKNNAVETYQVFTAPAPARYNTSRHWNTIASFVLNAGIVVALQCVKRSSMNLNTMWSAVFVSATLALLYTLLASNNREWRTKQFTNACIVTIHKFIVLLSMSSVLAFSNVIDPLF